MHMVYEKHEYYMNRKRQNYEINGILWKIKQIIHYAFKMQ
jgi:hypothetical protein